MKTNSLSIYAILLFISVFTFSCDENENENGNENTSDETVNEQDEYLAPFVGTWTTDEIKSNCEVGNRVCGVDDIACPGVKISISESGAYSLENNFDDLIEAGQVDVINTEITLSPDGIEGGDSFTYTFGEDELTVKITYFDGAENCSYTYDLEKD